tara:strand:+ start:697 stop:963 length:267 start_codon:yes stop_codon:yes gene_type:complete
MAFKMKGFGGFGNSPVKFEKDPKKFKKRRQEKPAIGPIDRAKGKKAPRKSDKQEPDFFKINKAAEGRISPKAKDLLTPDTKLKKRRGR